MADPFQAFRRAEYEIRSNNVVIAATLLRIAATKANFDPNEPRVPAGNPGGGQWTDGGHLVRVGGTAGREINTIALEKEEGHFGAHGKSKHVAKSLAELLAGMGPTARW